MLFGLFTLRSTKSTILAYCILLKVMFDINEKLIILVARNRRIYLI